MSMAQPEEFKPRFRGVSHQFAFFASVVSGLILVLLLCPPDMRLGASIFAFALSGMLGTSALYHLVKWKKPTTRAMMRRLDHTMIFVLIAGTYTPFALSNPADTRSQLMLKILWAAVAVGIVFKLLWITAPRWVTAGSYVVVGALGGMSFPALLDSEGQLCVSLVAAGGAVYIAGALIYAIKRPNPWPKSFGYHEVFHALTLIGASLHYSAVAVLVLPNGAA
jgi:hemolysin III